MSNQFGINETMVSTAPALRTNSRFAALKILCTEINDWQHGIYCKIMAESESWYVKNECVAIDKLQPVWFLVVTYIIKLMISLLINITDETIGPDSTDTTTTDDHHDNVGSIYRTQQNCWR